MKKTVFLSFLLLCLVSCGGSSNSSSGSSEKKADVIYTKVYSYENSTENVQKLSLFKDTKKMALVREDGTTDSFGYSILDEGESDYLSELCSSFTASTDPILNYKEYGLMDGEEEDAKLEVLEIEGKCSDDGESVGCIGVIVYESHDSNDAVEGHILETKSNGCSLVRTNLEQLVNSAMTNGSASKN